MLIILQLINYNLRLEKIVMEMPRSGIGSILEVDGLSLLLIMVGLYLIALQKL